MRYMEWFSGHRWGNSPSEKLNNAPKVTQLLKGKPGFELGWCLLTLKCTSTLLKLNSVTGNIQSQAAHLSDLSILLRDFWKKQAWNSLTNGTDIFHEIGRKLLYGVYTIHPEHTLHLLWTGINLVRENCNTPSVSLRNMRLCCQSTLSLSLEASIADCSIFKSRRPENSSWKLGSGVSLSHPKQAKHVNCKTHLNIHMYKYTHSV